MKLRAFALILTLALGVLAAPAPAEAQQAGKVYRIGFLTPTFDDFNLHDRLPGWLRELGYVQGRNVVFERRVAAGRDERLPDLAAELVHLKVDIIVTSGTEGTRAAKQATRTIPIVTVVEGDPVKAGLVATFARPGGNITGRTLLQPELTRKRLALLNETIPGLTRVGVLWNSSNPDKAEQWKQAQAAGRALALDLRSLEVRSRDDLKAAFEAAVRERCDGLLVLSDNLLWSHAPTIAALAAKHRLPAMYSSWVYVGLLGHGGLMSYAPDRLETIRSVADYVDKILKGAKPEDLPIQQPAKFELIINLKTAKALGLTIPPSLLFQADSVIK